MTESTRPPRSYSILEIVQKHLIEWEGAHRTKGLPFLKKHASPAFLAKNIDEVTHEAFQEELDRYRLGRPTHHNGNRLQEEFNSLMHFAVKNRYRTKPYKTFGSVRRDSQADLVLSGDEVEVFLLAVDRNFRDDFMLRLAVRAMVLLGLGLSEASNFDLNKVNVNQWRYVHADAEGRLRYIPIPRPMRPLLNHAIEQVKSLSTDPKPWFHTIDLQKLIRSIGVQCGLPGLMPAVLTRTAIYGVRKA